MDSDTVILKLLRVLHNARQLFIYQYEPWPCGAYCFFKNTIYFELHVKRYKYVRVSISQEMVVTDSYFQFFLAPTSYPPQNTSQNCDLQQMTVGITALNKDSKNDQSVGLGPLVGHEGTHLYHLHRVAFHKTQFEQDGNSI